MLGTDKKAIFSIEKYLPIQSMISGRSENSEHPWWSPFSIAFSWSTAFWIVFCISANYEKSALF